MSWPLHVTVAAVVERAGRFLLVQESVGGRSVINQPAGHLEQHESLVDAAVRETLEETAWQIKPQALVGIYRWLHPKGDTFVRFCFSAEVLHEEPDRSLDQGIECVLWLTRAELQLRTHELRSPMVLQCIDDYLAGTRIDLSVLKDIR
jgi:8-oxo-dGTP pyrophosphatase MutT (NUDIX family)